MFLLSRFPALKQMSPLGNTDFRVEVQETLRRKLIRLAAPEVQPITYRSTLSDSPALSEYRVNSQINLIDYTSASEGRQRNATDAVTVVKQTGSSPHSTLAPGAHRFKQLWKDHQCTTDFTSYKTCCSKKNWKIILFSYCVFVICYYFSNRSTILIILHAFMVVNVRRRSWVQISVAILIEQKKRRLSYKQNWRNKR